MIFGLSRMQVERNADGLAAALAISLPWSTSATSILAVLWLIALVPTIDVQALRREATTMAGGLPLALVALGVLGMLWADVTLTERLRGIDSFLKLLAIPLLLYQFRRSARGHWVLGGFLVSCAALLALSYILAASPWLYAHFPRHMHDFAVPVKNAATQSGEFVTCVFVLLFLATEMFNTRRRILAVVTLALAFGFLINIAYIATARTALVVIPVLLLLFGVKRFHFRGFAILLACAALMGAIAWASSPHLRERTVAALQEVQKYRAENQQNSAGERLEFWKKSIGFVSDAPLLGHGTGSIHKLFIQSAAGQTGASGSATTNPHNQTFAVAIQLGFSGVIVLWGMWLAHLMLFRSSDLPSWIGLVVVVQNVVGSVFNSHLFDFTQGWIYVVGVGVAGGMVLRPRETRPAPQ